MKMQQARDATEQSEPAVGGGLKRSMPSCLPGFGRGHGRGLGNQADHIVWNVLHNVSLLPVSMRDEMFAVFGFHRQRGADAAAVTAHLCGLHVPVLISPTHTREVNADFHMPRIVTYSRTLEKQAGEVLYYIRRSRPCAP